MRPYVRALKYLWASPLIIIGLLAACLWATTGQRVRWSRGAVVIVDQGPCGARMAKRGWFGFTLGITIFLWMHDDPVTEYHERVHVRQVLRWGILFPWLYLLSLAIHGYRNNIFERVAYAETDEWLALRE